MTPDMDKQENFLLPANRILKESFQYIWVERRNFFAMALLPVVALSIIGSVLALLFPDPILTVDKESGIPSINFMIIPLLLVNIVFYAMFAIAWHRKWLMGESDITIYSALKWDKRKTKFITRLIQVFLLSFATIFALRIFLSLLPGTTGFLTSSLGMMLVIACITLVFARLSLLLPAAAVDDEMSVKDCFIMTNGNSWRLGILVILPPIPLTILQLVSHMVLFNIFDTLGVSSSLFAGLIFNLVEQALNYIGIAVGVSALSMAYIFFKEKKSE